MLPGAAHTRSDHSLTVMRAAENLLPESSSSSLRTCEDYSAARAGRLVSRSDERLP